MTIQLVLFIVLVFTTFFSNGVQAYIHVNAYPLLAYVGKAEFPAYLKEYEGHLTVPIAAPYGLTVLSNLVLIFTHPDTVSVGWLIAAFVLNVAVAVVTVRVATPVYNRCKQAGQVTAEDMRELLRINFLRLALSTLSSIVVIYLLIGLLAR